jgi:hypothetical protein
MNTQEIITATVTTANPSLTPAEIAALVQSTRNALNTSEIKPVAKAADVLTSAQKAGNGLIGAALRPSRGRDNDKAEKWVINFTFSTWNLALSFARAWGERIGLNFNIQRQNQERYSVSIPIIGKPKRATTVAVNFTRTPDDAADFAAALKGLQV